MLDSAAVIASLRIRAPLRDRAALQLAIDRQLQGAELLPHELPPSALLLVRHLTDPLPGRLGGDPRRFRPPEGWTVAVRNRLTLLLADAERPVAGHLPSASTAVLFSDESEVIACLVLDLVRGQAGSRWWWQRIGVVLPELTTAFAGKGVGAAAARDVLRVRPRDIPAVFGYLAQWRAAVEVAITFDYGSTRELLVAMALAHQVDPMAIGPDIRTTGRGSRSGPATTSRSSWNGSPDFVESPALKVSASAAHSNLDSSGHTDNAERCEEPWSPWLPPSAAQRSWLPWQRCLLGLALALQSAPTLVRRRGFTQRAKAWWKFQERVGALSAWEDHDEILEYHARQSDRGVSKNSSISLGNGGDAQSGVDVQGETPAGRAQDQTRPGNRYSPAKPGVAPGETALAPQSEAALAGDRDPSKRPGYANHQSDQAAAEVLDTGEVASFEGAERESEVAEGAVFDRVTDANVRPLENPAQSQPKTPWPGTVTFTGEPFDTRLGGVLYLIHVLEDLDIPMVFEDDWGLATRLGPWRSLDLIARALLGDCLADVSDDAIWAALARLTPQAVSVPPNSLAVTAFDGQGLPTSQPHGIWSQTTPDYRAPAQWRTALDEPGAELRWTAAHGRLWLWSDNLYLIASVRRNGQRPEHQVRALAAEWQVDTPAGLRGDPLDQAPLCHSAGGCRDADLCAWVTAAAPAVARRLRLALEVESNDPEALGRLLSVEGRVYVTRSHIDLVADLDQIWLPARRAGLDRNPGWLADYGRVVLFHFR